MCSCSVPHLKHPFDLYCFILVSGVLTISPMASEVPKITFYIKVRPLLVTTFTFLYNSAANVFYIYILHFQPVFLVIVLSDIRSPGRCILSCVLTSIAPIGCPVAFGPGG